MIYRRFVLAHAEARRRAAAYMAEAPEGAEVVVKEATMNNAQRAKFHALCGDLEKSEAVWAGKRRSKEQWKTLFKSGHAIVAGRVVDIVEGLEGEIVDLESTALMSKSRGASLIEYALAWCAENGVCNVGIEPPKVGSNDGLGRTRKCLRDVSR